MGPTLLFVALLVAGIGLLLLVLARAVLGGIVDAGDGRGLDDDVARTAEEDG